MLYCAVVIGCVVGEVVGCGGEGDGVWGVIVCVLYTVLYTVLYIAHEKVTLPSNTNTHQTIHVRIPLHTPTRT